MKGSFPFMQGIPGVKIPVYAPNIEVLPGEIQQLFGRAFLQGYREPRARPSPVEWHGALQRLRSNLRQCGRVPHHQHYDGLASCPWCQIENVFSQAVHGGQAPVLVQTKISSSGNTPIRPPLPPPQSPPPRSPAPQPSTLQAPQPAMSGQALYRRSSVDISLPPPATPGQTLPTHSLPSLKGKPLVMPENSMPAFLAALFAGIIALDIIYSIFFGYFSPVIQTSAYSLPMRFAEAALLIVFILKKKPQYICIPLIMNVIDKITLLLIAPYFMRESMTMAPELALFPLVVSAGILVMFLLLRAGKVRKKTAMPVIVIFCAFAFIAEIYNVAWLYYILVNQGMLYYYGLVPAVVFIFFISACRFASYALASASLKSPDDNSLLQPSPPVAVPAQEERSRFLLDAAIASILLFVYLFTRM
jgi:hypothetical protein